MICTHIASLEEISIQIDFLWTNPGSTYFELHILNSMFTACGMVATSTMVHGIAYDTSVFFLLLFWAHNITFGFLMQLTYHIGEFHPNLLTQKCFEIGKKYPRPTSQEILKFSGLTIKLRGLKFKLSEYWNGRRFATVFA